MRRISTNSVLFRARRSLGSPLRSRLCFGYAYCVENVSVALVSVYSDLTELKPTRPTADLTRTYRDLARPTLYIYSDLRAPLDGAEEQDNAFINCVL